VALSTRKFFVDQNRRRTVYYLGR